LLGEQIRKKIGTGCLSGPNTGYIRCYEENLADVPFAFRLTIFYKDRVQYLGIQIFAFNWGFNFKFEFPADCRNAVDLSADLCGGDHDLSGLNQCENSVSTGRRGASLCILFFKYTNHLNNSFLQIEFRPMYSTFQDAIWSSFQQNS